MQCPECGGEILYVPPAPCCQKCGLEVTEDFVHPVMATVPSQVETNRIRCVTPDYYKEKLELTPCMQLPVDIIVPASIPDVINEKNVDMIKARLIVEAANIPATIEIERKLHERGILVVPDIIANAGGVISSYAEYSGKNPQKMFDVVKEKIVRNVSLVLKEAEEEKVSPRDAALKISQNRVRKAMERRKMSKM